MHKFKFCYTFENFFTSHIIEYFIIVASFLALLQFNPNIFFLYLLFFIYWLSFLLITNFNCKVSFSCMYLTAVKLYKIKFFKLLLFRHYSNLTQTFFFCIYYFSSTDYPFYWLQTSTAKHLFMYVFNSCSTMASLLKMKSLWQKRKKC